MNPARSCFPKRHPICTSSALFASPESHIHQKWIKIWLCASFCGEDETRTRVFVYSGRIVSARPGHTPSGRQKRKDEYDGDDDGDDENDSDGDGDGDGEEEEEEYIEEDDVNAGDWAECGGQPSKEGTAGGWCLCDRLLVPPSDEVAVGAGRPRVGRRVFQSSDTLETGCSSPAAEAVSSRPLDAMSGGE
ncbi:unnamed protein product, partial [Protopolystoma xenopodis]